MIRQGRFRFWFGSVAGFAAAILLGEFITRLHLPDDLSPFLGEASPLTGIYRPDPELGADYRSPEEFRKQYGERLRELEQSNRPGRTWAWFGNSFVQAQGMLGDMAQTDHRDIRMFYLRRNTELRLQVAQMRLLLDSGLKPERVILVMLPIDLLPLGKQPLHTVAVNSRGAITYRLDRTSGPFDLLLNSSRLALLAWIRTGRHTGEPDFEPKRLTDKMPASLKKDLTTIFTVVGRVSRQHHVPVTVLLLPNREQIFGTAGHAFQDFVSARCRAEDIDCLDATNLFVSETDKLSLFLADWHFTDKANRIVLDALYGHWPQQNQSSSRP